MDGYRTLDAWKHAHQLALSVLEATDDQSSRRTWAVLDQLRRAAVSVEANIVEGFALGTIGLIQRHLRIAIGSAAEAECLLRLAQERQYLPPVSIDALLRVNDRALATLCGLRKSPRLLARRRSSAHGKRQTANEG